MTEEKPIKEKHWKEQTGNKYLVLPNSMMLRSQWVALRRMKLPPFHAQSEKEDVLITYDEEYVVDYIGHRIISPLSDLTWNELNGVVGKAYSKYKKNETSNKP